MKPVVDRIESRRRLARVHVADRFRAMFGEQVTPTINPDPPMPYGKPAAMKLRSHVLAHDWQTRERVQLMPGAVVEPIHPGADQDGWDGEWKCRTDDGQLVAIPGDALTT